MKESNYYRVVYSLGALMAITGSVGLLALAGMFPEFAVVIADTGKEMLGAGFLAVIIVTPVERDAVRRKQHNEFAALVDRKNEMMFLQYGHTRKDGSRYLRIPDGRGYHYFKEMRPHPRFHELKVRS